MSETNDTKKTDSPEGGAGSPSPEVQVLTLGAGQLAGGKRLRLPAGETLVILETVLYEPSR